MDKDTRIEYLKAALWYIFHENPSTEGELALAREKHPVLMTVTNKQIMDVHEGLLDNVDTWITDSAKDYADNLPNKGRMCRCLNPRCEFKTVMEEALLYPFPDPKLIATISPGDTVPLGLCPECRMPVYQPEEFPEDEVDGCQGDDFCNCGCNAEVHPEDEVDHFADALAETGDELDSDRAMFLAQDLAAQRKSLAAREKRDKEVTVPELMEKALRETLSGEEASRVLAVLRNVEDNTGVLRFGEPDCTSEEHDPLYTK